MDTTLWDSVVQSFQVAWSARPKLPMVWVQQLWMYGGWGLVWVSLLRRLSRTAGWTVHPLLLVALVAVLLALPKKVSLLYYWVLVWQYPSLLLVGLCVLDWWRSGQRDPSDSRAPVMAMVGVVLGWLLLLDMFVYLPFSLYAWGTGTQALGMVLLALSFYWVVGGIESIQALMWGVVLGVFVLLRLPTGNVWDSVLDPWLWLLLHAKVLAHIYMRVKHSGSTR